LTGLFEASWRPRKAVTVLWRRVDTISPDDYATVVDWARSAVDGAPLPWLDAMATNEAAVEPAPAIAELTSLLQHAPPPDVAEAIETLRDLIWEASDSNSDWLAWRPCRVCGRRWATLPLEGVQLCPRHRAASVLLPVLRAEMATYDGLVDHTAAIARLEHAALAVVDVAGQNGAGAGMPLTHAAEPAAAAPLDETVDSVEAPAVSR
jgi:hypothetical protein